MASLIDICDLAESLYKKNNHYISDIKFFQTTLIDYLENGNIEENKTQKVCQCSVKRKTILEESDSIQEKLKSNSEMIKERELNLELLRNKLKSYEDNFSRNVQHSIAENPLVKTDYESKIKELQERIDSFKRENSEKIDNINRSHQLKLDELNKRISDLKSEKVMCDEERDEIYCELQGCKMIQPSNFEEESESIFSQINKQRIEMEEKIVHIDAEIQTIRDRICESREKFKTQFLILTYLNEDKKSKCNFEINQYVTVESLYKKFIEYLDILCPFLNKKLALSKQEKVPSTSDVLEHSKLLATIKEAVERVHEDVAGDSNEWKKELLRAITKHEVLLSLNALENSVHGDSLENKENHESNNVVFKKLAANNSDIAAKNRLILDEKLNSIKNNNI